MNRYIPRLRFLHFLLHFMRISVPVLVLICAGAMTLLAAGSKAQGALDKPVTIDVRNQSLATVLDVVAAQVKVSFSYGDNVIFQTKLNYKAEKEKLGTLLDHLLKDYPYHLRWWKMM